MPSRFLVALLTVTTLILAACNTMQGLGEDIEHAGAKLQNTAKKAKD